MLSIIIYGRNDQHGYNYHKRVAISLNCLAAVLSDPNDEIVFVDYNTPDSLPTLAEAIQDTLTIKTKAHLRVLRVRPVQHARFSSLSHLPVLEPIARNIALQRMRTENRWVLSTNPDIICVPTTSLRNTIEQLEEGFYCLPRLEIPETLWESTFDRSSPEKTIAFLREQSANLHMHTIVKKPGFIQYSNPGDFQLMSRKDIFAIGGFHEEMLHGWHVDSNLAKRMSLYNRTKDFPLSEMTVYHCNHTRQSSLIHSDYRTENSWTQFVSSPKITPILSQKNWGMADQDIEEISLTKSHIPSLLKSLKKYPPKPYEFTISLDTWNQIPNQPARTLTYLADYLCTLPPNATIAYLGYHFEMLQLICAYLEHNQMSLKILCFSDLQEYFKDSPYLKSATISDMSSQASIFIFDFIIDALPNQPPRENLRKLQKSLIKNFFFLLKSSRPSTQFIGLQIQHTPFQSIFLQCLSVLSHSYVTGITYGHSRRKSLSSLLHYNKRRVLNLCLYYLTKYLFKYTDLIYLYTIRINNFTKKAALNKFTST